MKNTIKIIAAAAVIATGFAGAAFAHQDGKMGGMGMHGAGMGMAHHGGAPGAAPDRMRGMHNPAEAGARLAALKGELKITAAQEPAWQQYEAVVNQQTQARQAARDAMRARMQDPNAAATVDHAAQREAMSKLHTAQQGERDAARVALVAVLSPEQKAVAERRLAGGPGVGMNMAGGRAHGMGHGMAHGMGQGMGPGQGKPVQPHTH